MADGANYRLKGFDEYEIVLGDQLRGERATMGKSLLDVQRDLKIKASYIAAIENCDLEVFTNTGFIAGYVRSYARYLGLDPEVIYSQFCNESGFSNGTGKVDFQIAKAGNNIQRRSGPKSNWKPGQIGQIEEKNNNFVNLMSNFAPVFVLLLVIVGTGFGAMSVLKEVQKIDVVALEEPPDELMEMSINKANNLLLSSKKDIYSSEELALPVFESRDKALSMLKPEALTALADVAVVQPNIYKKEELFQLDNDINESKITTNNFPDPVVRTNPDIPKVELLAMTPAWVRVKNMDGDIILEKTLGKRETFSISKEIFSGELRAGNAQNVYFIIDKEVFGPLSETKSVVKKVSLNPKSIKDIWGISLEATADYLKLGQDDIFLNTAENME